MYQKNKAQKFVLFLIIIILLLISFSAGLYFSTQNKALAGIAERENNYLGKLLNKYSLAKKDFSQDVDFNLFWQTWDELKKDYIDSDKVSDKQLFYGALRGMVGAVGDPYTVFMEPKVAEEFADDLAGTFEGIGAEIGIKKDILTIIAPLPDMPAEKAGLMAGDKIFSINGTSTTGISIDEAVAKIRGPKGTEVILSIAREGEEGLIDIAIKRGTIIIKSVRTEILEDNFLFIKVSNFNNDTEKLFAEATREALDKNIKGIVLDLRNNPGGYLDTAIEMASEWVEDGIIVTEQFADKDKRNEHLARGRARLKDIPTVVLVNKGSASASEIVSGALQDYDKAIIVGEITFGKGSVQTVAKFDDGSSLKVTIAKWLTPKGRSINDSGIDPDLIVPYSLEDYQAGVDPQKEVAISLLKNGLDIKAVKVKSDKLVASTTEQKK